MNDNKTIRDAKRHYEKAPLRSPADWKPEPCGLTREQVRAIVIEQIG